MWSRACSNCGALLAATLLSVACSSSHSVRPADTAAAPVAAVPAARTPAVTTAAAPDSVATVANSSAPQAVSAPAVAPPPARAAADFTRAVGLAKAGKDDEAELEFQQIAAGYPNYPGALVNLGILYRKHGDFAKSDEALHGAVQRDARDVVGWNELGITLRQEGKFHDAADAYNQAISTDPGFAPAYRNLAIVLDLYLGDTVAALTAMQRYQELAPDDKAVVGWIADLKQRAGKNAAPAASPASSAPEKAGG